MKLFLAALLLLTAPALAGDIVGRADVVDGADLAAFKEDGLALVRRIKTGSEERNWIVHGVVTDVLQFEAAGPLRLQKTKYLPTDLQMERKVTSLRNIDEHSILFQMLTNEVLRLDYAIQNALDNGTGHIGP